jgi:predicted MPP superfamily phosphohydrolase
MSEIDSSRRRFLFTSIASVASVMTVDAFLVEPYRVEVTVHRAASGSRTLRIVQLSDLHLGHVGGLEREVAARLTAAQPDVVVLTGDIVDENGALGELETFLGLIGRDVPKVAIVGNWERWGGVDTRRLGEIYRRANGELLINRSTTVSTGAGALLVTGLDDLIGGRPSIEHALRGVEPAQHHLVLAHCPQHRDWFARYSDIERTREFRVNEPIDMSLYDIALVLAGHTHGGQANLFGWAPFVPPGSGRYLRGWYRDTDPPLYVSRGIGTSIVAARFNSIPEIAVFDVAAG